MGTLASWLAKKQIPTPEEYYWAEVEGDIEDINGVLRITQIRVLYHLKVPPGKREKAQEAFSSYIVSCPAAQTVIGCIDLKDKIQIEEMN